MSNWGSERSENRDRGDGVSESVTVWKNSQTGEERVTWDEDEDDRPENWNDYEENDD